MFLTAGLKNVEELDLYCTSIQSPFAFTSLRNLQRLTQLDLGLISIPQTLMRQVIMDLPKSLVKLSLGEAKTFSFLCSSELIALPCLTFLDLALCPGVDDRVLRDVSQCPSLVKLSLWGCKGFTGKGLQCLSQLKLLRKLDIGGCDQLSQLDKHSIQAAAPALVISTSIDPLSLSTTVDIMRSVT